MFHPWRILMTVILALGLTGGSRCQAQPLTLVPDKTVLVVPAKAEANETAAAKLLQTWLRKASRVDSGFDTVTAMPAETPPAKIAIALGNTTEKADPRVAGLNDDGFLIHRVNDHTISIAGPTTGGTYYGAVAFLDRYAGVRFYMPTELWTSLPAKSEIIFDGVDYLSQPFVISCDMSGLNGSALGDGDWQHRFGGSRLKGGTHQHNLGSIFPPEKFAATHPEIYPIYDGQRYIPKSNGDQSWQVNFTEPATLEAAKESITEYFEKNSHDLYIAVSINDGGRWSDDPRDQQIIADFKTRDPSGDYKMEATTDIYWRFMNQLAAWMKEKFPDKLLVGLAYGATSLPPKFPLADNLVVYANFHISELYQYNFPNPVPGKDSLPSQWLDIAHHFGNHEWFEGDGYLIPRMYTDYWSSFMQGLAARLPNAFMHAEAYPNWGFDGPKYYVISKLWWDPSLDPRKILRQFCDDMFGPAAAPMDEYFNQLEALWKQLEDTEGVKRKMTMWSNQFSTTPASRAIIAHCHDLLAQALAAAPTGAPHDRIALFAKCFTFSESLFDLAANPSDEARYNHAVELAKALAPDKWAVYDATVPMKAIQAIYKPATPTAKP
jgi:hypothetical protein